MSDNNVLEYVKQSFDLKSKGFYKQAIEMIYKALELENDNKELLFQLGELYFLLNNYPRALQYVEKILNTEPEHLDALNLAVKIYAREHKLDEAKSTAEKIYKIKPDSKNLSELISILGKMRNAAEIEKYTSDLSSADDIVKIAAAKAYCENFCYDKAKSILESLSDKDDEDALVLLGKVYFSLKNRKQKIKLQS